MRSRLDISGSDVTIPRFADCLDGQPVGAIRISMGLGSIMADVDRVLEFLASYANARAAA